MTGYGILGVSTGFGVRPVNLKYLFLLPAVLLAGCSSFGEGLMRGFLSQETEDTRQCYVRGAAFDGIEQFIGATTRPGPKQGGEVKLLMVHGIGNHLPGYATRLAENLARELQLSVVDRTPKVLNLRLYLRPELFENEVSMGRMRGELGDSNGIVTVQRYRSKDGTRGMTFYELTWSEITEPDKRIIEYDNSGDFSFRRAGLNNDLKHFVNSHLPDPMIYLGDAHGNIQTAVTQTLCWMFTRDYTELPNQTEEACKLVDFSPDELHNDSFAFISHSLGSRILTDAMQSLTAAVAETGQSAELRDKEIAWADALKNESMRIFMLSNQLPLLQLGRQIPPVTNQFDDYCTAEGEKWDERVFAQAKIVAFSDPNDILSWSVPPGYADRYMDSRMCPVLTNVIINIAEVRSVFGIELASADEAHTEYDNDARVIKMIAHGISNDDIDPMIAERCEWMQVN